MKSMTTNSSNRWRIAAAGVVMQLALGAVYAWSVFRIPLTKTFGWTVSQVTLAFTLGDSDARLRSFRGRIVDAQVRTSAGCYRRGHPLWCWGFPRKLFWRTLVLALLFLRHSGRHWPGAWLHCPGCDSGEVVP